MTDSETKSLTLSSNYEEVKRVEPFVDELREWIGFGDKVYGNVLLALSEAATNAIVHGNKKDETKKVHIRAFKNGKKLKISIEDEGEGFDPSEIPNPLQDENLLKEGGRGVYLIEQYADEVTYSDGGSRITIAFLMK